MEAQLWCYWGKLSLCLKVILFEHSRALSQGRPYTSEWSNVSISKYTKRIEKMNIIFNYANNI